MTEGWKKRGMGWRERGTEKEREGGLERERERERGTEGGKS